MSARKIFFLGICFLTFLAVPLHAENWPHWRGPHFDGSSTETKLPDDFSLTNNVKWVANLPGPSAATPIVWNDTVFVSSTDTQTKTLRAIALDRKTGKELWNQEVGMGFSLDDRSNLASPSPVTDGKLVIFYYGTGDLVAFDFGGSKLWSRNIQKDYGQFAMQWTYGASPTLAYGKLFIQVLQRDVPVNGRGRKDGPSDSYLLALDPQTGKELWKHNRPTDAKAESHEAYSTPIPLERKGREEILVAGGDYITGHDPNTGEEIWRWGTWNPTRNGQWRLVTSPVPGGNVILGCAPRGAPVYAIKAGGHGTLDDASVAWKSEDKEISSDVPTPLFYKGKFYIVHNDKKTIARVDPATGKADWVATLDSRAKIESSPTGADKKIYFMNQRGDVFIVAADDKFKLLRTIPMGDDSEEALRSTIAVAEGNLFIRTGDKLYCIGETK